MSGILSENDSGWLLRQPTRSETRTMATNTATGKTGTTDESASERTIEIEWGTETPTRVAGAVVIFADTYYVEDDGRRFAGDIPIAIVDCGNMCRVMDALLDAGYARGDIRQADQNGDQLELHNAETVSRAVAAADTPRVMTDGGSVGAAGTDTTTDTTTTDDYLDLGELHEQESERPNSCRCSEQFGADMVCPPCAEHEFVTPNPDATPITEDHWGQAIEAYDDPATGAGEACQCQSCGSRFHVAMVAATEDTSGPNWEEFYECQNCGVEGSFRVFGEPNGRREWNGLLDYPDADGGLP